MNKINQRMQGLSFKKPPKPFVRNQSSDVQNYEEIINPRSSLKSQDIKYRARKVPTIKHTKQSRISKSAGRYSAGSSNAGSVKSGSLNQREELKDKYRLKMPKVSAKSWGVYQIQHLRLIYGQSISSQRQVAGLTLLMNFVTILEIIQTLQLDPTRIRLKVSKEASCVAGKSANLAHQLEISLYDLYFGMMLERGNDAAYQIAQVGGALLNVCNGGIETQKLYDLESFTGYYQKVRYPIKSYIQKMKSITERIGLNESNFGSPIQNGNPENYSCIEDIHKLCSYCINNPKFREVIETKVYNKTYTLKSVTKPTRKLSADEIQLFKSQYKIVNPFDFIDVVNEETINLSWKNHNKIQDANWLILQSGITTNAGPCLIAMYNHYENEELFGLFVILLESKSGKDRWKEVKQIANWVTKEKLHL